MNCEYCKKDHNGSYGSGRFCCCKCAKRFAAYTNKEEANKKISKMLTGRKGRKRSLEERIKISKTMSGSNWTKEKVKKIRNKMLFGSICENCEKQYFSGGGKRFCSAVCQNEWYDKRKAPYTRYKDACKFKFNVYDYPNYFNINLINEHGWYAASNRGNNINGVSRDHMYSVNEGFKNNIDPNLIAHPANCKLVLHTENQQKHAKSSITLEKLKERIKEFETQTSGGLPM
jgi:hypothetical protein